MAQFDFDASTVAPQASTSPIPAGTYLAQVIESDIKDLASGNGKGMKLTFEIIDGQYKGRRIWENLNIQHTNEDSQRIAQSQLSALCHAVGVIKLRDTAALHMKPVYIKVTVREAEGKYQASNNVKGYESANPVALMQAVEAPSAPAPASKAPAWAKRG